MTPAIYGELTADRSSVVVMGVGESWELAEATRRMQLLTPLVKTSVPPGALTLPATWPAAIQLANTLGPAWQCGPALSGWLAEQVIARTAPATKLQIDPPAGLVPRDYQIAGACLIAATGRALILDEPGLGKTVSTILGLVERAAAGHDVLPIVVVCPNAVMDSWVEHIHAWAPQWRAVAWRGDQRRRRRLGGTADVYVTGYAVARTDAGEMDPRTCPLIALNARTVVADECVPTGTPVDTPSGPRAIETLQVGEQVIGIDHATGLPVATPVRHIFTHETTAPLVHVHGVAMTPDHPVWTGRGYLPAAAVRTDDLICEVIPHGNGDRAVRMVLETDREAIPANEDASVLRPQRRDGGDSGRRVFNIETGTGNYVAGGLLVHNCHLTKAQTSEQSRAVRRLATRAAHFVGLSGTPITHNPADLWPGLVCLAPGAWPSRERWIARYCDSIQGDYGAARVLGLAPHAEPEFRTALLGQYRRVAKADVLTQLPPKVYSVRTVELPPAYRKAYDDMAADMLAELPDGGELSVMGVLAQLTRLSQLASAAADVKITYETVDVDGELIERPHQHVTLKAPSWKVDELLEVMAERPGRAGLAFAPSRQLTMLAGSAAEAAGHRVGYIVGGQSAKARTAAVAAFQRGELDLICATTGAGGVGLTLTAASYVTFLQRPYSLVEALQSEDRSHRLGSEIHDSIEIIDIVARNTIDTRIRQILRERAGQLSDLVQDPRIVAELLGGAEVRGLRRSA